MNFPTMTYQVDFAHDPSSASFTWTDLTSRALSFSCTRGRSHEQASMDAGTAAIEWKNTDGVLDPTNTGGTYYPNVIPYRRVQVKAVYNSVTYNIYTGVVERWPLQWEGEFGTVPTQCSDVFAILANKILSVGYEHEVLSDSPVCFWPLTDSTGSTTAGNRVAGGGLLSEAQTLVGGDATFGAAGFVPAETATSLTLNETLTSSSGDDLKGFFLTGAAPSITGDLWSVECWVKIDANLATAMSTHTDPNGTVLGIPLVGVTIPTTGALVVSVALWYDGTAIRPAYAIQNATTALGATYTYAAGTTLNDGQLHHLVATCAGVGTVRVYVDGVAVITGASPASSGTSLVGGAVVVGGWPKGNYEYGRGPNYRGIIQYAAIYPTALSSARVTAHLNAGLTGFAGDTADARITRILGYAGWTGATALDACSTTMLSVTGLDGQSALAAIQAVEQSEGGAFYVGKDGTLTYKSRTSRMSTTASSYTFGDGASELPYTSVAFDYDPTFIYNDIQIQRDGASAYYATDSTSQGHYGTRTYAKTLSIQSDSMTADAANWDLNSYKDPHLRVASITLVPSSNAALWPACLNIDIGTRVTVKRRPHGSPNTISADFFVEQVTHNVQTAGVWITNLALSPVALQALIADDTTFGICDSTFVAAY